MKSLSGVRFSCEKCVKSSQKMTRKRSVTSRILSIFLRFVLRNAPNWCRKIGRIWLKIGSDLPEIFIKIFFKIDANLMRVLWPSNPLFCRFLGRKWHQNWDFSVERRKMRKMLKNITLTRCV